MKTEKRKITGTAYLTGDKKTTMQLVDMMVSGLTALYPDLANNKDALTKAIVSKVAQDFEFEEEVQVPENFDEAVKMLPNEMDSVAKATISKAITNQYDKLRAEKVKELVAGKTMQTVMQELIASLGQAK